MARSTEVSGTWSSRRTPLEYARTPEKARGLMRCASCGTENVSTAKFCKGCGTGLARTCPGCGASPPVDARFCDECGSVLGAESTSSPVAAGRADPAAARPLPGAASERRWVSVLFCDLVGFTTLSESKDAEEVRELLSAYFDVARTVVGRYGGTVEKFIGDAVMAAWGIPTANEDDAERAVRAALDLVGAIERLGRDLGLPDLSARAGVLSGEAAVNLEAVGQGMVAGDLVNTASRLQSAAGSGKVLVGDSTYLAARDAVAFEDVGELTLKGKAEPMRAWRAVRVVAQRKGVGRTEAIEPSFVGRDEELRAVTELLHAAAREKSVRFVSVTGIAGIGKSRLAWELQKYVDGLAGTVYWHQGRSPAYGEGVTFWALAEMVRMRAGIAEGEEEAVARERLTACVAEFVADESERHWIEPRLAYLLALGDAPAGDHQELMSAWRIFFERIAARAPVVMVFEDLHWADTGLLDYIDSVVEWSRSFPILLLTLARPELADRRPTWGTTIRNFTSLHLEALGDGAMRELVSSLVPGLALAAADRLLERAEGIPLYAVETVRALADSGVLERSGGCYQLCGEVRDVELPDTLHALIASRLDALGNEARALVLDAAVLGKSFSLASLSAVSGRGEEALLPDLRDLAHREVFALNADPRSPERGQYGFLQAVVREVAYSTLSRPDRRTKHLAAAHFFESLQDDELAGVVATHYLEAHRASRPGPEADAVAAKARDWLGQACARARALGSSEEALAYAEEALGIAQPGTERAALLELAGETSRDAAEFERALGFLEEALTYYEESRDPIGSGRATALLAEALSGLHRYAEAIRRAERAFGVLDEVEGSAADVARAQLAWMLSFCCTASGAPAEGVQWAEKALAFAERVDDPELLARGLRARAVSLFDLGRHREAVLLATDELALAVVAGSLRDQAEAKRDESAFVWDDDPQRSLGAAVEGAELARRAGVRELELRNLLNAAETGIEGGDWEKAWSTLDELAQRRLPAMRVAFRNWLVTLLDGLTGDPVRAARLLSETAEAVSANEYVPYRATYLKVRAFAHLAAFELEHAFEDAAAVVALDPAGINSAGALSIQAHAALWRGDAAGAGEALAGMVQFRGRWMAAVRLTTVAGCAALDGRVPEAVATYRAAAEAWSALGTPLDRALCGLDAALLLGPSDRPAELVAEAREVLARIGAVPFLRRLDERTAGAEEPDRPERAVRSVTS